VAVEEGSKAVICVSFRVYGARTFNMPGPGTLADFMLELALVQDSGQ
jgi:hypothetical protein